MRLVWVLVVSACGRVDFDRPSQHAADAQSDAIAAAAWSSPQAINVLSSSSTDWGPTISPDSAHIVFTSNRGGSYDLYISTRQGASWTPPQAIAALNSAATEIDAAWNATGTRLYFSSDRSGSRRLYESAYNGVFAAPTVVAGFETIDAVGPALSHDDLELFYTLGGVDIARAVRLSTSSPWTIVGTVTELSTTATDGWPTLSPDGLTMYFESNRAGQADIFATTRPAVGAAFSEPVAVPTLDDTAAEDGDPELSSDGATLYFASDRMTGNPDLYFAIRTN